MSTIRATPDLDDGLPVYRIAGRPVDLAALCSGLWRDADHDHCLGAAWATVRGATASTSREDLAQALRRAASLTGVDLVLGSPIAVDRAIEDGAIADDGFSLVGAA